MIIIETTHHFTFSSESELPHFSCTGVCKKAWWPNDTIPAIQKTQGCPACGGQLQSALEGLHYTVSKKASRPLNINDFRTTLPMDKNDQAQVEKLLSSRVTITNLSVVKPEFEAKAKSSWAKPDTVK
jgi:hypothetical protein